uniref:Cytochrome b6-f complex subunit 6 n=1 Tax=Medakamo hakoo TaxID=3113649 RepID=A0A8E4BWM5_9CHLO|nr:cytochrome b6-f complex subunit 6 [Medakamo hakoo]
MITILGYIGFLGAFFVSTIVIYFSLLKIKLI